LDEKLSESAIKHGITNDPLQVHEFLGLILLPFLELSGSKGADAYPRSVREGQTNGSSELECPLRQGEADGWFSGWVACSTGPHNKQKVVNTAHLVSSWIVGLWDLASYDTVGNLKMRSKGLIEYWSMRLLLHRLRRLPRLVECIHIRLRCSLKIDPCVTPEHRLLDCGYNIGPAVGLFWSSTPASGFHSRTVNGIITIVRAHHHRSDNQPTIQLGSGLENKPGKDDHWRRFTTVPDVFNRAEWWLERSDLSLPSVLSSLAL